MQGTQRILTVVLSLVFILLIIYIQSFDFSTYNIEELQVDEFNSSMNNDSNQKMLAKWRSHQSVTRDCNHVLAGFNPPVEALLIDTEVLEAIEQKDCSELELRRIKIAVLNTTEPPKDKMFKVIMYEDNSNNDFLLFHDEVDRIVLRPNKQKMLKRGNLLLPQSIKLFLEMWRRSRLIPCLDLKMDREERDKRPTMSKEYAIEWMSIIRNTLLEFGMFSFLMCGTVLGWYRECGLIPHTNDVDLGVFIHDYNQEFFDALINNKTELELTRRMGMINDSLELTVVPGKGTKFSTDIFFLINENGTSWMGGTGGDGKKSHFTYPEYDPYCTGILNGHLFWVTCRPELMLKVEYGSNWHMDKPSRTFTWNTSPKNYKPGGQWDKDQFLSLVYWTNEQKRTIKEFLGNRPI